MSNESFSAWLSAATRQPLLTHREELIYGRAIRSWLDEGGSERLGRRALDRLIQGNLRLVINIWRKRFTYVEASDCRLPDLLQDGALGLRHAAIKFDPSRGYKFSTYAANWIYKYFDDSLRNARHIHLSAGCSSTTQKVRKLISAEHAAGRPTPSISWLSEKLGQSADLVAFYLDRFLLCATPVSLDAPARTSGNDNIESATLLSCVPSQEPYDMAADRRAEKLAQVLTILMAGAGLSDAEKYLVRERLLNPENPTTYVQIQKEVGIEPRKAPQVLKDAVERCGKTAQRYSLNLEEILSAA